MFVSTTQEGYKATYELFKKDPIANSHLVQMSTYSNPHLPDDYIEDLKASYPLQLIQAYLNGEFVNLVASPVWTSYDEIANNSPQPIKPQRQTKKKQADTLHIGMDFNVGRGCAVVYIPRILPPNHPNNPTRTPYTILVAVDEVVDSFDTPDTIRYLNDKYPHNQFPTRIVYPDASGESRKSVNATISDLALLKHAKFKIKKPTKNPPIKDRIAAANAALYNSKKETKVYLCKKQVPNLSNALVQQVYDKNGLPKKGENKYDDMTDAFSYPLHYMFPIKRQRMFATNLGGL